MAWWGGSGVPHLAFQPSLAYPTLFCLSTVLTRARSRRTVRILSGASSWPIDFWMRIRNIWSVSSRSLGAELVGAQVAQFGGLHSIFSCAKRVANLVRIGSFAAASFIASRASVSVTPSISNSTRPGRTTATH